MSSDAKSFILDVEKMISKAKSDIDTVARKIILDIGTRLVEHSPVGNPSLWKVNKIAVSYNTEVSRWNSALRDNPENLTKAGRLKRGLKVNDGMDIRKQSGYSGGRFRSNWDLSINTISKTTYDAVDKSGSASLTRIGAKIMNGEIGDVFYITNSLPYSIKLEYGHSKQAPSGIVGVTIVEFGGIVKSAAQSVSK